MDGGLLSSTSEEVFPPVKTDGWPDPLPDWWWFFWGLCGWAFQYTDEQIASWDGSGT